MRANLLKLNLTPSPLFRSDLSKVYYTHADSLLFLYFINTHIQNTVRLPVYTTRSRRGGISASGNDGSMSTGAGFVFEADLRTTIHANHWILQGVCLLLNID